jgi:hypothetical protein
LKKLTYLLAIVLFAISNANAQVHVLQPGPDKSQDIWVTSLLSYSPDVTGIGGGKADETLRVGGWFDWYFSLLQFDLSDMPPQAKSATLSLYHYSTNDAPATKMYLRYNVESWNWKVEGTGPDRERLWWDDRPWTESALDDLLPAPQLNTWYNIDVTSLYNKWQNGTLPNYGITLWPQNNSRSFDFFYSSRYSDAEFRPKLTVVAVPEPGIGFSILLVSGLLMTRKRR